MDRREFIAAAGTVAPAATVSQAFAQTGDEPMHPPGSVTLPSIARNKSPGTSGSRRSDDFTPCLDDQCPEGSVRSC